jgi:outer membrane protein TolC
VGLAPGAPLPYGEASIIDVPELPATGVPAQLIGHRPDVRSAYLAVQAADLRVSEAIADRFPRITILGSASTSGEELRDLFDNWLATIAAELVQPIIDGGRRRAEVERTRAVTSQAIHDYGQAVIDALQDVEDALTQEQRQAEYLVSLEQQLATARQVIDRTRDNYLNGQLDYLRVLEALTTRQALERSYVTAQRQHVGYRIDLCRALACGWTMERPALAAVTAGETANAPAETNEAHAQ